MRISEYFKLNKTQYELDFVDVNINYDTPLFLDPYYIAKNDFPFAINAQHMLKSFFDFLLLLLREDRVQDAEELFSHLGETNEVCLGFSKGAPKGKGMGPSDAIRIFNSLRESKAFKTGVMEDIAVVKHFCNTVT